MDVPRTLLSDGALVEVRYVFPDWWFDDVDQSRWHQVAAAPVAIELTFEDGVHFVQAEATDDTLEWVPAEPPGHVSRRTNGDPWDAALGKPCTWFWTLTNQHGYDDGAQLLFSNGSDDAIVQIIVWASTIEVSAVVRP